MGGDLGGELVVNWGVFWGVIFHQMEYFTGAKHYSIPTETFISLNRIQIQIQIVTIDIQKV
jgi:hypothetical protein